MAAKMAWAVAGLISIIAIAFGNDSLRLVAVPVLIVFLVRLIELRPEGLFSKLPRWIGESAGPALLVALALVLFGPLLIGEFPVNHDHPAMLLRAWITGSQFLSAGSTDGFSPTLFAGFPANSQYPLGTDLLVCAIKALSLGFFSWELAYCWALFLFVMAYPLALYALGRRFAGKLAGTVAGLIGLLDRGMWFQSGWDFNLNWGVWSMGLSFCMCLLSLWGLDRVLSRPSGWNSAGTAAAIGYAILCHPMAAAILGLVLPLYVLVIATTGKLDAPGLWLPRTLGTLLLGVGLAAFWLIPFAARQAWFEPLADAWQGYPEVIRGLMDGSLLSQFCPALLFAGLLGMLLGTRYGHPFSMFLLVSSGLLLFFSSNTFLIAFDVLEKFPVLSNLQLQRFAYFIRSALIIGCGLLVHYIVFLSPQRTKSTSPAETPFRRHGRRLLLAAALAPLIVFATRVGPSAYLLPAKPLAWSSESALYGDMRVAAEYLNTLESSSKDRIAVVADSDEHLLLVLPVHSGLNIFKLGFMPQNNYRFKFESTDNGVWKAINISHVLSIGPMHRPDLEEIRRFGQIHLYRFLDYSPERITLEGPGRASLLHDEPEAMDIRLSGTGPSSRLLVHRARYALWEAELEGKPVPIVGTAISDTPLVFMEIAVSDGILRLRYSAGTSELIGTIISWLSLLALGILTGAAASARLRALLSRILQPLAVPIRDGVTLISLAAAAIGLVILVVWLLIPASLSLPQREVVSDLAGNDASVTIVAADHLLRECIYLPNVQGTKLTRHFDDVPLGNHIQGHCTVLEAEFHPPGQHPVYLTVSLDGTQLGRFTCPARRGWHSWEAETPARTGTTGRITIQTDTPSPGETSFCFTTYTTVDE